MAHQNSVPAYDIHPMSVKMIARGHPWITKDKFTAKFHPRDRFIVGLNQGRPCGLFLHDPTHKVVAARLWAKNGNFQQLVRNFKKDLADRIQAAFAKRAQSGEWNKRQNLYLIYAEADGLPGLLVQLLGSQLLIQYYSNFWESYQDILVKEFIIGLEKNFDLHFTRSNLWVQARGRDERSQSPAQCLDPNLEQINFTLQEFDLTYHLRLGKYYDIGIYTDMANIRDRLVPYFQKAQKVLNLFSYTGAISLFALKHGAEVTSVDLSGKYLDWLDKNLASNPQLNAEKHTRHQGAVASFLQQSKDQFDLIISDPPSSSSDGAKKTSAIKEYEKLIPLMDHRLTSSGTLVLFLNTHQLNMGKFKQKIEEILNKNQLRYQIQMELGTSQDCPQMKGFPEGSYLKGLVLRKL